VAAGYTYFFLYRLSVWQFFCNVRVVDVIKRRDLDKLIKNPACPKPDLSDRMQLRDTIFVLSI
jgi:hypothetical protein